MRNSDNWIPVVFSLAFVAVIVGVLFLTVGTYTNPQTYSNCAVNDKDRTAAENGGSDMRVYTSCGTFRTKDMLFAGEFDSADTYASLVPGNTYDIETTGYRIPFFSSFPIIREVK